MKRLSLCLLLLLLFAGFFSAKIVGFGVKTALRYRFGWNLSFLSSEWKEGRLLLSQISLADPSFHAYIEKAELNLSWNSFSQKMSAHLFLQEPYIRIKKEMILPEAEPSLVDVSCSIQDGVIYLEDEPIYFSLNSEKESWKAFFKSKTSSALLAFEENKYQLLLEKAPLCFFRNWIPFVQVSSGSLSGKCLLDREKKPLFARLQVADLSLDHTPAQLKHVNGSFSFDREVGAKWELKGEGSFKETSFPFSLEGKSFFKQNWLISNVFFEDSSCSLSKEEKWHLEANNLSSSQVGFFQQGLSFFLPSSTSIELLEGRVSLKGTFEGSHFEGQFDLQDLQVKREDHLLQCEKAFGCFTEKGGDIELQDPLYQVHFSGPWTDWKADVDYQGALLSLKGGWDQGQIPIYIEKGSFKNMEFLGKGWVNLDFDAFFSLEGQCHILEKKIPFSLPMFYKHQETYSFDFRLCRNTWDLFRLVGEWDGKKINYSSNSHLLNQPLYFLPARSQELDFCLQLPARAIRSCLPFLEELGLSFKDLPIPEMADLHVQYKKGLCNVVCKGVAPFFSLHVRQKEEGWDLDLDSALTVSASLLSDGTVQGSSAFKDTFRTKFKGKIDPHFHGSFSLEETWVNLAGMKNLPLQGEVRGNGHFIYQDQIEADFDFLVSSLTVHSIPLENEGQIHLHYSSSKGALLRGIHLHGECDCIVDLLKFDHQSHWVFENAQIHIPSAFLTHSLFQALDQKRDLNFTANLDVASDFSSFSCFMKEGFLPYAGEDHHIQNLNLVYKDRKCFSEMWYQGHFFRLNMDFKEGLKGKLTLGEEASALTIDWTYLDRFYIHSMEGSFSGMEASFHEESPNTLLGSARIHFSVLSSILPKDVADVFREIKMGQGYEIKGRLKIENNLPYFSGILGGKGIELFGFQFKTLLGRIDASPHQIRLHEIKISDSAGIMKIDEILLKDEAPWTIQIPNLVISEMRPCLLQKPHQPLGPLTPLVLRNLTLRNFKGFVEEGSTYTAEGSLRFINSYKREETVFDLPANVLSRIVGIDLDLLIPVKGDLTFEIKDGFFYLKDLSNAYSEGNRSQFFLEEDPPPRMSLDGDLKIFIKMKQFVLLKITESFLISIDGPLNDPQFRLKKKSFFGIF